MAKPRPPGQKLSDTNPEAGPPASMRTPDNSLVSGPTLARPKGRTIIGNLPVIVESRAGLVETPSSPEPEEEEKTKERYIVGEVLGEGGMGIVYKGTKLSYIRGKPVPKDVAIKVLKFNEEELRAAGYHDLESVERQMTERFITECQVINLLNHPNIIEIMDVGEKDFGSGREEPFYVMPFHKGRELEDIVEKDGPLPWGQVVALAVQATRALEAAHNNIDSDTGEPNPIIHRDIKPANIFVITDSDGTQTAKILDFGIAKIVAQTGDNPTNAGGAVMGTPFYMAPEQARGMRVDKRTDIYGLGSTMYHLLTGTTVFYADGTMELLEKVREDTAKPLRERRSDLDIPEEAEKIVMKCLERDPANRYQTMGELREDIIRSSGMNTIGIARVQSGNGWDGISDAIPRMESENGIPRHTMQEGEMVSAPKKRKKLIGLIVGLGLTVAAGTVTTGIMLSRRAGKHVPERPAIARISDDAKAPMAEPMQNDARVKEVHKPQKELERTVTFVTKLEGVQVFKGKKLLCTTAGKEGSCTIKLEKGKTLKVILKKKGYKNKIHEILEDARGGASITMEKRWSSRRRRRRRPNMGIVISKPE